MRKEVIDFVYEHLFLSIKSVFRVFSLHSKHAHD